MHAEDDLVARALGGESAAFEEIVRASYGRLYATAFHLLGNHEDAEDVTQECLVRAHAALALYRSEGSFAGWLRRILVHLVRDRYRRRGRRPLDEPLAGEELTRGGRAPSELLGERELALLVAGALERLPESLRIAFLLRTREGLSYDEISHTTGVTPATARTQVMRARRALAERLRPYLDSREDGR